MKTLDGKIALVTGASTGIGAAAAHALAREGARVAVVARRETASQLVVGDIVAAGGDACFVQADVAVPAQVERMVAAVVAWGGRLDIAVNNAALLGGASPAADTDPAVWDMVIATNLTGMFHCMKREIAAMRKGGGGVIVNVLSGGAITPLPNQAAYTASKFGALGLTTAAAIEEAAHGIRINAVCPGATKTDMASRLLETNPAVYQALIDQHPIKRLSSPEEQAAVIAFLCGPGASFMIGAAVPVDGGWHLA
jgi:NAD(P)-dependent dehydrogenase (short-subunit alcohol dehydrogenase family)